MDLCITFQCNGAPFSFVLILAAPELCIPVCCWIFSFGFCDVSVAVLQIPFLSVLSDILLLF